MSKSQSKVFTLYAALMVSLACTHVNKLNADSLVICDRGQPEAVIVVAANASKEVRAAASILQNYIYKATGARLAIIPDSIDKADSNVGRIVIRAESTVVGANADCGAKELAEDGFVISVSGKAISITGGTGLGAEFGVYAFLEKYLGVRWLFPGPLGEHIPQRAILIIPEETIAEKPAFFSRQLIGLESKEEQLWARRNRLHHRIDYSHNLYKLFPPEKYAKTHPEFYPLIDGRRYIPWKKKHKGWQPCFSADGLVEEAVKTICAYFARYPTARSYSLAVTDGRGYCQCPRCQRGYSGKNSSGEPHISELYFRWANAVAAGVLEVYPDKYFGSLAYSAIADPPTGIGVHPRIVPYIAFDRLRWIDKSVREQRKNATVEWGKKSHCLGWYDYMYGTPYLVPRVYFHQMAEYLGFGCNNGVKAMTAEAYPNWGEGPKLYIALKLMWDPFDDVDRLLQDWYTSAVGEKAAPYLAQYFDIWEKFWTERMRHKRWLKTNQPFLPFYKPDYLAYVTYRDIEKSRALLEKAITLSESKSQKARASLLLRAFEYYEASAVSYLGIIKGSAPPKKGMTFVKQMNRKRFLLLKEFRNDPFLAHPVELGDRRLKRLLWGDVPEISDP